MALARPRPTRIPSPRAPWGWAITGALAGTLVALVVFAPARWAAAAVAEATGKRVVLDAPRGTVWNGSAQLLFTGGSGSQDVAALPSRVEWRMRP
ncbi:MAG TPA: type II secretion system protein N, partial [Ramlibacter sp.]|nr:type II secretion system protein N [Ramlibacter sp.]